MAARIFPRSGHRMQDQSTYIASNLPSSDAYNQADKET